MGEELTEKYYVEIDRCQLTNRIVRVTFYDENKQQHRLGDDPATQEWDPATGNEVFRRYAVHGVEHRSNGLPSCVSTDPLTKVFVTERWRENGRPPFNGTGEINRSAHSGEVLGSTVYKDGVEIEVDCQSDTQKNLTEGFPPSLYSLD